ncbi:glycoside hydrolase family 16 [Mycolicibacterium canariasense]|uniref:Glycoside hydrolase family 16 n=1 Tax=Mycolicibacterium canariasense TaxID=228230 RepID=A0A117IBL8_MYCCR|nr:hypothetical protein [Mycolicibacterium canariasense]MCV7213019.1 hypothetical protein [Mycolicibacterium canariasense]ORV10189.1 hypothetical protein AWB94_07660 [Mycolicibacterium canariasense]GAS98160.1 glycoside hydrolase family 16 [Mycolicibacterium canariasense]
MGGRHRSERAKPAVTAWLGAGAITLGIGAALTTGAAVANADAEGSGGASNSSGATNHDSASTTPSHEATSTTPAQNTTSAPKKKPRHRTDTKPDTKPGADSAATSAGDENPTRTTQDSTVKRAATTKPDTTPAVQSAAASSTPKVAVTAKAAATPAATTAPTNPLAGIIAAVQSWGHAIQVQYFNNKPRIVSVSAPTLNSDGTYSGQVMATDKDGDPLVYSVVRPYDGSTVTVDQSGHYTITPSDYALTRPTSDAIGVTVVEANADKHYHGFGQIIGQVVQTALHNAFGQLHYPPYSAPDYATTRATVPGVPWGNTDPTAGVKVSAKLTAASAPTATAFTDPLTTLVYGLQGWFNRTFNNTLPTVTMSAPTKNADGSYTGQITATDIDGDPLQVNLTPTRNGTITYTDHGNGTYTYTFIPSEAALTTPNSVFSLFVSAVETNANDHFHGLPQIQDFIVQSTLGNFARALVPSYSYSWPPYDALTWAISGASIRVPIGPVVPPTST